MAQTNDNNSLADFNFDSEESFFGLPATATKTTNDVVNEVKRTEVPKTAPKAETVGATIDDEEDIDEDDNAVFNFGAEDGSGDTEDNDDAEEVVVEAKPKDKKPADKAGKDTSSETGDQGDQGDHEEVEGEKDDAKFFSTLASELKEKGIFQNVEIKPDEEITEERFFELQEAELEARMDEALDEFADGMDDEGKKFIQFKKNGGKTTDFLATLDTGFNLDNYDNSKPEQVETALRVYLSRYENLEGDDLQERIDWLKDGGKSKANADKYVAKMIEDKQKRMDKLLKQQEDFIKERQEKVKKFNAELSEVLVEGGEVGIVPITKTDKELAPYLTKPTVKAGKNSYIPQFHADLQTILKGATKEDKQKMIAIAKIIKSNFKPEDVLVETATKITQIAKSKLKAAKVGLKGKTANSGSGQRSLADRF